MFKLFMLENPATKIVLLLTLMLAQALYAPAYSQEQQQSDEPAANAEAELILSPEEAEELRQKESREQALQQLREVQESLREKVAQRKALRKETAKAAEDVKEALEAELEGLNSEIELLEKTFEQVAIGGVDLSLLGQESGEFDWREELVLIVQPLIENVKSLTEKPRKIESLRRVIEEQTAAVETAGEALQSIDLLLETAQTKAVVGKLKEVKQSWISKKDDLERKIQLAEFQLASLEGKNIHWFETVKQSLSGFMTGRGLTLLLMVMTSIFIWVLMWAVLWLFRKRSTESHDRSTKVHYRLAAYAYRALTAILIAVAIMTVLYMRQDLLLLAIVAIILVGLALAFKNLLPRYIAEGRLLLNIGAVRELERVMYNGVPWRVNTINMFCSFTNPHINGTLRVPISALHDLVSRPTSSDDWFPSKQDDWILYEDNRPMQVVEQGVELVELRDLNRISHFIPTADYYAAGYRNISAGEQFRVAVRFGIDYAHQGLDTQEVCDKFKSGIEDNFKSAPFKDHVEDVRVEFDEAAESSLNYVMFAWFGTEAARHHNRIKRRIQTACVAVCNEQGWGIPFPQLTVHRPHDGQDAKQSAAEQDES